MIPRKLACAAAVVAVALLVTSCAGATTGGPATTTTMPVPTTSPVPTTAPGGAGLVLTDADNGRAVTASVGTHVTVVLASTYWIIDTTSGGPALRSDGPPVTDPRLAHCVPGQGCGTVTAPFTAVTSGTAVLSASRTVCGEALACSPAQRSYRVSVTVP